MIDNDEDSPLLFDEEEKILLRNAPQLVEEIRDIFSKHSCLVVMVNLTQDEFGEPPVNQNCFFDESDDYIFFLRGPSKSFIEAQLKVKRCMTTYRENIERRRRLLAVATTSAKNDTKGKKNDDNIPDSKIIREGTKLSALDHVAYVEAPSSSSTPASAGWSATKTKVKSKAKKGSSSQKQLDVDLFLRTFKTVRCENKDSHDHKECDHYHSEKDSRRNPYNSIYLVSEVRNDVEKVYHPHNFRTALCPKGKGCDWKNYCAFAHDESQLRVRDEVDYPPTSSKTSNFNLDDCMLVESQKKGSKLDSPLNSQLASPPHRINTLTVLHWSGGPTSSTSCNEEILQFTTKQYFFLRLSKDLRESLSKRAEESLCQTIFLDQGDFNEVLLAVDTQQKHDAFAIRGLPAAICKVRLMMIPYYIYCFIFCYIRYSFS